MEEMRTLTLGGIKFDIIDDSAVSTKPQYLSEREKKQARENIGVMDVKDGKDGKDGYTPVKGVDYFDGVNGKDGIDGYTPVKGVDYFDGQPGKDGKTPVPGEDYYTEEDKVLFRNEIIKSFDWEGGSY